MTHDPLCKFSKRKAADDHYDDGCDYCDLIAKARDDTLDKARNVVSREWKKPGVRSLDEMLRSLDCIRPAG